MVDDKTPQYKVNSDKWWSNWWKSNFTDPLNWEAFNFNPFHLSLADKLGINSYWGFAKFIIVLSVVGVFLRFGLGFLFPSSPSKAGNSTLSSTVNSDSFIGMWINYPELHSMFVAIVIFCIIGSLFIWWFYNKEN